jgi:hypothetical protein
MPLCELSVGEFLDRYSILEIKLLKVSTEKKQVVAQTLAAMRSEYQQLILNSDLKCLAEELYAINYDLWEVEDKIRLQVTDSASARSEFVELGLQIIILNSDRHLQKQVADKIANYQMPEIKCYKET